MKKISLRKTLVHFLCISLLAFLALMGEKAAACYGANAGIITDLKGKVTLTKQQRAEKARLLDLLPPGAKLSGGKQTRLTVTFSKDGHTETVTGEFYVVVQENSLKIIKGTAIAPPKPDKNPVGLIPQEVSLASAGALRTRTGPSFDIAELSPLSPVNEEYIDTLQPTFRWNSFDKGTAYKFLLLHDMESATKFPGVIIREQGKVPFPREWGDLVYGHHYEWKLSNSPIWDESKGMTEPLFFHIINSEFLTELRKAEEQAKQLYEKNPGNLSPYVTLISLYLNRLLYNKALAKAQELVAKRPNDPNVHNLLGGIYNAMNLKDLSEAEFKKVNKLEAGSK
ncbi:MAG: hypothetical protein RDV48_04760 [Candidatus Eremiobacteraeota bacterium]|nr:hypothetical protein [Candidatus Eremiobacteraeota bacterium]